MEWHQAVEIIRSHVVRIDTPSGRGSGFLVYREDCKKIVIIATARHVIEHAYEWREPLRLRHFASSKEVFLSPNSCVINTNPARDLAYIKFAASALPLPEHTIKYLEARKRLMEGNQVGWCGYPFVAPSSLCFFTGHISAWIEKDEAYLVDGVAIHGVSGGPVFRITEDNQIELVGLVTEYRPNYATGQALPGVSLIRAIGPFAEHLAKLDEKLKQIGATTIPSQNIPPQESDQKGLEKTGML